MATKYIQQLLILALVLGMTQRTCYAQTIDEARDSLTWHFEQLNKYAGTAGMRNKEAVTDANNNLKKYLLKVCRQVPGLLTAPMHDVISNVSSADKKLRVYSWNTYTGDRSNAIRSVVQYKCGKNKTGARILRSGDEFKTGMCNDVLTYPTQKGRTVYVIRDFITNNDKISGESVSAWVIKEDSLKPYRMFEEGTATGYVCEPHADSEEEPPTLRFSNDKHTLYVPIITNGQATGGYIVYKFNGSKFTKQ